MKQYSNDLRERVCQARSAGVPRTKTARILGVSPGSVSRWNTRQAGSGSVAPKPRPGRTPKVGPGHHDDLRAQVATVQDATRELHRARWHATHGVRVSTAIMSRLLAKLGLTLKKDPGCARAG